MKHFFTLKYKAGALAVLLLLASFLPAFVSAQIQTMETKQAEEQAAYINSKDSNPQNGWGVYFGERVYYIDGAVHYGWLHLDEGTYYFYNRLTNVMASGFSTIGAKMYYFDPNNDNRLHKTSGWFERYGKWYYAYPNAVIARGLANVGGALNYFDKNGVWQNYAQGWVQQNLKWYFYVNGQIQKGWIFDNNSYYYLDENTGEMRTGWVQLGDDWYYMHSTGKRAYERTVINGVVNLFSDKDGSWLGYGGWFYKGGKWYYVYEDGTLMSGRLELNGAYYEFDYNDKSMKTGWFGKYYAFPSGQLAVGGVFTTDRGPCCFNYEGSFLGIAQGWIQENGSWYYYIDNKPHKGTLDLNGKNYRFDSTGKMLTGWVGLGSQAQVFYYSPSGEMLKEGIHNVDGINYYFSDDGFNYGPAEGWAMENGNWYFYVDGKKQTSTRIFNNGAEYHLDNEGLMYTGWFPNKDVPSGEYFLPSSGAMAKNQSLVIDGISFHFDSTGKSSIEDGWFTYKGNLYYSLKGQPVYTWLDYGGEFYYFDYFEGCVKGWRKIEEDYYYFDNDGKMLRGTKNAGGVLHVFDEDGVWESAFNGWREENGKWYYYKNGERHIGWLELGANWYYMFSDGEMAVGTVNAGGVMHVFDSNGVWQHAL